MAERLRIIFISLSILFIGSIFSGAYFTDSESISSNLFSAGQWASPVTSPTVSPTTSPTVTPTSGEIIITEFMANPDAVNDEKGEWLEVYNASASTVNFNGWRYRDSGIGNWGYIGINVTVDPGNYFIFGKSLDQSENGGVPVDYRVVSSMTLNNNGDSIILEKPDGLGGYITVDEVVYDNSTYTLSDGIANMLKDLSYDNSQSINWGQSTIPYGDGDLGTPGGPNV